MPDLSNLVIAGVPLLFIVFGLVEFLKKFNVKGNKLTLASMIIGIVFGVGYKIALMYPGVGVWIGIAVFSISIGLAASGIYDFGNARFPKVRG